MQFLGLTVAEWAALIGISGVVIGYARKGYRVVKNDVIKPAMEALRNLETSIADLSKNVESETRWIHDRHGEVVERLNNHEDHLDRHDIEIAKHRERLKTLCNDREKGYK